MTLIDIGEARRAERVTSDVKRQVLITSLNFIPLYFAPRLETHQVEPAPPPPLIIIIHRATQPPFLPFTTTRQWKI